MFEAADDFALDTVVDGVDDGILVVAIVVGAKLVRGSVSLVDLLVVVCCPCSVLLLLLLSGRSDDADEDDDDDDDDEVIVDPSLALTLASASDSESLLLGALFLRLVVVMPFIFIMGMLV